MPIASCHCGRVQIKVRQVPDSLVNCNCSICHRYGALWAFYPANQLLIIGHPEFTKSYIWGQKSIRTMHCSVCACVTHWAPLDATLDSRCGVNARNFPKDVIAEIPVRQFDGATTWSYST